MFNLRQRERSTGSTSVVAKDIRSSQSTMELSFSSDDDLEDCRPSCAVLTDYESDSLDDFKRQDSLGSFSPRGGLWKRSSEVRKNLKVTFSQVKVRHYGLCVGDNPAVSLGVPITMDWTIVSEETTSVDSYDAAHPTGKCEAELAIPADEREQMVRRAGFTTEDIRVSVRQVNTTKMEREKTIDTLQNASSEEFMEKLKKGIWNATFSRKSKQSERAMLRKWRNNDAKRVLVSPAC